MSDPLGDFNRRMAAGSTSWTQGPPQNAAESAAQSLIDARQPRGDSVGGGSIDFGGRICAIILIVGLLLFGVGAVVLERLREGAAILAILGLIVSGFLILIGGGGLAVAIIKELAGGSVLRTSAGKRRLGVAMLAGLAAWWLAPWLWMLGLRPPGALLGVIVAALVFGLARR